MRFEFATATRIVFGAGTVREVAPAAQSMGTRALVVIGCSTGRVAPLVRQLGDAGVESFIFPLEGEPSVEDARRGAEQARAQLCDLVIAFGGGSALDAGKAIAALLTNPGDLTDYLEVVGKAFPLSVAAAPFIAIPTTAGTGAEVTRNAVLASPEHRVKVSMRSPLMLARLAVIDPELTLALPPEVTASTGLDALTQLVEPFVSIRANPMTDALCREGMERLRRSIRHTYHHGEDLEARTDMAFAALLGGLALANAGLGVVHGFAGPIGGMFPAPHGAVCAALLPFGMQANLSALRTRAPESAALRRFDEVARILTGIPSARAEDGVQWVSELVGEFKIPPLRRYGLSEPDVGTLVEKSMQASSMKANAISLTLGELGEVLRKAL